MKRLTTELTQQLSELPCFVFDEAGLESSARLARKAFAWRAQSEVFCTAAGLPNPKLLSIMRKAGMNVVCCNRFELLLAQKAGYFGEQILYAPTMVQRPAMKLATELGCSIALDSANQIISVERERHLPNLVGLRLNCEEKVMQGKRLVGKPNEIGIGMDEKTLLKAVSILRSKGVREIGLHAHLVDGNGSLQSMVAEARDMAVVCEQVQKLGMEVAYCMFACNSLTLADSLHTEMEIAFHSFPYLPIHFKIGSFLQENNVDYVTEIADIKEQKYRFLCVDAPLIGNGVAKPISDKTPYLAKGGVCTKFYFIYGTSMHTADRFANHQFLQAAEIGDSLIVPNAGQLYANSHAAAYLYTKDEILLPIRKAQTDEERMAIFPE